MPPECHWPENPGRKPKPMLKPRSDAAKGAVLAMPATAYVGVLVAAPLGILVLYSFWTQTYVTLDKSFTWDNYKFAVNDPLVRHLLVRSVWIAALVTLATVALAYPIAYFIAMRARRKTLWLLLITIPFWTSYLLRVFAWKLILGFKGVMNSALLSLGLIDEPLTFLLYNEFAVVLTLAHAWAPFAILPIYVSLQKIDHALLEAATDLGCSKLERFLRVTLPLTIPGIIASCLIIFIPTVGDYVTPALVGGSDGKMIANLIQVQFGAANNWPLGATLSLMAMASVGLAAVGFVLLANLMRRRIR